MKKTNNIIDPNFRRSEIITIEFLNQTITGKFIKWDEDRPFDVFLQIEQDYNNYVVNLMGDLEQEKISLKTFNYYCQAYAECNGVISFNEQLIRSINGKTFKHFAQ